MTPGEVGDDPFLARAIRAGVEGAIGKRADTVFDHLAEGAQHALDTVFTEIVDVDPERGMPVFKRGLLAHFEPSGVAHRFIAAFIDARLFVCDDPDQAKAVVEVAHEALLTNWPRLQKWIEARFDDFRLLRQLRQEAAEWGHPWPGNWDPARVNTSESGLLRTTAVGMHPVGVSPVGALDMAGTVWEWCLNEYERPENTRPSDDAYRVARGGSWGYGRDYARAAYRAFKVPVSRLNYLGFRVVCSSPIG